MRRPAGILLTDRSSDDGSHFFGSHTARKDQENECQSTIGLTSHRPGNFRLIEPCNREHEFFRSSMAKIPITRLFDLSDSNSVLYDKSILQRSAHRNITVFSRRTGGPWHDISLIRGNTGWSLPRIKEVDIPVVGHLQVGAKSARSNDEWLSLEKISPSFYGISDSHQARH